ncbi:Interferon-activable protein 205-A [Lemmus lemmus]
MSSDQFDCFKSLMSSDLRLERNMQERYTRVQIADMMENEFPNDAGLGKLIDFCEAYTLLKDLLKHLKKKNQKVKRKSMNNEKTAVKKAKESERQDHPSCSTENTARCQTSSLASSNTSLDKNQKTQTQNQSTTRGAVHKNDAMTVMVLNASEQFVYKSTEPGGKTMLHAIVATVSEYFLEERRCFMPQ